MTIAASSDTTTATLTIGTVTVTNAQPLTTSLDDATANTVTISADDTNGVIVEVGTSADGAVDSISDLNADGVVTYNGYTYTRKDSAEGAVTLVVEKVEATADDTTDLYAYTGTDFLTENILKIVEDNDPFIFEPVEAAAVIDLSLDADATTVVYGIADANGDYDPDNVVATLTRDTTAGTYDLASGTGTAGATSITVDATKLDAAAMTITTAFDAVLDMPTYTGEQSAAPHYTINTKEFVAVKDSTLSFELDSADTAAPVKLAEGSVELTSSTDYDSVTLSNANTSSGIEIGRAHV